jgi:hypothetical protein
MHENGNYSLLLILRELPSEAVDVRLHPFVYFVQKFSTLLGSRNTGDALIHCVPLPL